MSELYTIEEYKTEAEWLEARKTGLGSSDAAPILGLSPWSSPLKVYCEKLGIGNGDKVPEYMELGLVFEPALAEIYQRRTGRKLSDPGQYVIFRNKVHPFLIATPDRIIEPIDNRGPGLLEMKSALGFGKAKEWEEEPPLMFQVQHQHQMAVTGFKWGSLAAIVGGPKFVWADMHLSGHFTDSYIEKAIEFWQRVVTKNPPEADAHPATKAALAAMYPQEAGEPVALAAEFIEIDEELQSTKAKIRILNNAKGGFENQLKAAIGSAPAGVMPNGISYTLKLQKMAAHEVKASEFRQLRRKEGKNG